MIRTHSKTKAKVASKTITVHEVVMPFDKGITYQLTTCDGEIINVVRCKCDHDCDASPKFKRRSELVKVSCFHCGRKFFTGKDNVRTTNLCSSC